MDLLTAAETAEFTRLSVRTLANYRHEGGGPPYRKIRGRVVYERADVETWVRAQTKYVRADQPVLRAVAS